MGTMTRTMKLAAAAAAIVLAMLPAAANAASPWHQVTASNGGNIDQVGLLRTADGTLHVAWQIRTGGNTYDLRHTSISPSGAVQATTSIVTGWAGLNNPALVTAPGGTLRVFFGGIHTTAFDDPNQDLNTATSGDGGATWTVQPGDVAAPGDQAYGSPVAATAVGGGLAPYE